MSEVVGLALARRHVSNIGHELDLIKVKKRSDNYPASTAGFVPHQKVLSLDSAYYISSSNHH